ncbi:MAG: M23 family metallopeptidase [Acidobacteria bacterium]|nr:M23 family metallopeptidase [Acidobacteriota bacterium]
MRKRYYVVFVTREPEGELRKIHIPVHYLYVFLAGALIGMFTITGMAGSYTRMLLKVARFNQLRSEKEALNKRYTTLEQVAKENEIQAASLSSLANEVSEMYGLKADARLPAGNPENVSGSQFTASLDRLSLLKTTAMNGSLMVPVAGTVAHASVWGMQRSSVADWLRLASAPNLWPVEGRVTGSFGERIDPFNGEGAFHSGVDISTVYGEAVHAAADGVVALADQVAGYGRLIVIEHANDISTRYGHLSGFAVTEGQMVRRGEVIGYVGLTGRSTGPHLHYEIRINDTPVNPYRFLRKTFRAEPWNGGD